ncbi:TPA: YwaF family protein [Streptococcus agalactiae]
MIEFFSNIRTEIPQMPLLIHSLILSVLPFLMWLTLVNRDKPLYKTIWSILLGLQLITIYTWFFWAKLPLSESLPLYHCRIGMFVVLLARPGILKDYFALLGVVGGVLAMIHPDFYPYQFLHVTNIFFFIGHFALFVLSLLHLMTQSNLDKLNPKLIIQLTLLINMSLIFINLLTGGNYGFMVKTPILGITNPFLNLFIVTTLLSFLVLFVKQIFQKVRMRASLKTEES